MSKKNLLGLCLLTGSVTFALAQDHGDHGQGQFKADLNGYNEVPAILTTGSGQLTITISSDQKSLDITLNFTKLAGVAQSAGLYFGLPGTTGGLMAPICGGTKPTCPSGASATVTTTIVAADIPAIAAQGLTAGDLTSVIQAVTNGAAYINVSTTKFTNGEIRGPVERGFEAGVGRNRH